MPESINVGLATVLITIFILSVVAGIWLLLSDFLTQVRRGRQEPPDAPRHIRIPKPKAKPLFRLRNWKIKPGP